MPYGFWYLGQDGQPLKILRPRSFRGLETSDLMFAQRDKDLKDGQFGEDDEEEPGMRKYFLLKRQPQPQSASGNNKILPFPRLG